MDSEHDLDRASDFLKDEQQEPPADPEFAALSERIIDALRTVHDPEIPVHIFDLGLIYKVDVDDDRAVHVDMTLTSPGCPVAGTLPEEVRRRVEAVDGVHAASVEVVWDPPWNPSMMSEDAQLELGIIY